MASTRRCRANNGGIMATNNAINANQTTPLALVNGGTSASLTAANGGIFYSNATTAAILAPTSTANQPLLSGASGAPGWSTATYPGSTTINQILYSSAANTVTGLSTANNSALVTNGSGVPSLASSLSGDFTYTSSTAGATRTLTVSNTDNTNTASSANILASTGGASSGDATYQASTTTTVWTWGIDNSVTSPTADPFVISQGTALGTNNIMSVATSGEINFPLQPAFLGILETTVTNVTGNGAAFQLGTTTALTEIFDQNADFNTNGTFTSPVTGRYFLQGQFFVTGNTISTVFFCTIVTSNRAYVNTKTRAASATDYTSDSTTLADMDLGDTATLSITVTGEAGNTDDIFGAATSGASHFCGYLAC